MAEKKEKVFPKGIYAKAPHEKVKAWTVANISIKVADAIPWLKEHENVGGYVNLIVKTNDKGMYVEKDNWTPTPKSESQEVEAIEYPTEDTDLQDVPF